MVTEIDKTALDAALEAQRKASDDNHVTGRFAPPYQDLFLAGLRAYLAAAPTPAGKVRVKRLEWDATGSQAISLVGIYRIHVRDTGVWWSLGGSEWPMRYENNAQARDAAQADYEALSTLQPDAPTDPTGALKQAASSHALSATKAKSGEPDEEAIALAKDAGADFVLVHLGKALGFDQWDMKDGTEEWEGDVLATLYGILHGAKVLDDDNRRVPSPNAGADAGEVAARCEVCDGPARVWFAPNKLWNLVKGGPSATDDPGGMLCPNCFIDAAEAAGIKPTAWVLDVEDLSASPAPETADMVRQAVTRERDACLAMLELPMSELLLHMGEMTAQEKRTLRAFIDWRAAAIRARTNTDEGERK